MKEKRRELITLFNELREQGMYPKSVTTDGNQAILNALRRVWPQMTIQRCIVHIQRQGLMWCRAKPKRIDAQKLRILFRLVTEINTKKTAKEFLRSVNDWDKRYGKKLLSGKITGPIVSDLVRARSMLLNALPDMFYFLHDKKIPSTTNALEGYFSRLKARYRQHRGLAPQRRESYFRWFLHLVKR